MKTTISFRSQKSLTSISKRTGAFIRKRSVILAGMLCLIGIGMTGCFDTTGPTESAKSADEGLVRPGIGSTYIYKVTDGKSAIPNEYAYDTMVVTRTGLRVGNEMDVVELRHKESEFNDGSYTYLSYSANGDIKMTMAPTSTPLNNGDTTLWMTLPIGSRRVTSDSVRDDGPYADFPLTTFRSEYIQPASMTVSGNKLTSHKVSMTTTYTSAGGGSLSIVTSTWVAPAIGNIVRWEVEHRGDTRELISYTLKP